MVAFLAIGLFACVLTYLFVHEDDRVHVVLLAAVIVSVSIRCCVGGLAHADAADEREALALARLCLHEAGWDSPDDCRAIYAVALNRGASIRAGFGRHLFAGTTRRAPWILELDASGNAPPHMVGASWTRDRGTHPSRRDAWLALLEECRRIVTEPAVCAARGWGNAHDMERARLLGRTLAPIDCGDTRNIYYVEAPRRAAEHTPRAPGARPGALGAHEGR